jgi:Cu-Zn family superoxide dismutase
MTTSLTVTRGQRAAALLVTGLSLSLVAGIAGPVSAAPATVSRGGFVVLASAPAGTVLAGRAQLVRVPSGRTLLMVQVRGLAPGHTYGVHLHNDACSALSGHYKHDAAGPATPPNELWASSNAANAQAGITANAAGNAAGNGVAPWIARSTARSVVLHTDAQHGGTPAGGTRLACADLA